MASKSSTDLKLGGRKLKGVSYDVRQIDSVAIIFVGAKTLRGIYRLTFANGEQYAGQTVNIVTRYASHRRRWADIIQLEFFPIPTGDLNGPERALISITEKISSVRNLQLTGRPGGSKDLEIEVATGESVVLPWDRRARIRPGQNPISRPLEKFYELTALPEYPEIRWATGWFVYNSMPDPFNTQRHLWVSSCLPSTNRGLGKTLLVISVGPLEVFFVSQSPEGIQIDVNTALSSVPLEVFQDERQRWWTEPLAYNYDTVQRWTFSLAGFLDIIDGEWDDFPHTAPFLDLAYELNVRIMRRGGNLQSRHHNDPLGADILAASLCFQTEQ